MCTYLLMYVHICFCILNINIYVTYIFTRLELSKSVGGGEYNWRDQAIFRFPLPEGMYLNMHIFLYLLILMCLYLRVVYAYIYVSLKKSIHNLRDQDILYFLCLKVNKCIYVCVLIDLSVYTSYFIYVMCMYIYTYFKSIYV